MKIDKDIVYKFYDELINQSVKFNIADLDHFNTILLKWLEQARESGYLEGFAAATKKEPKEEVKLEL